MNTATYQQLTQLIHKKNNILILTHAKADCDGLGAALSAYLVLKELGKKVTVVTNDPTPENLQFLPAIDILSNSLVNSKDFIITVDSAKAKIGKIKYNVEGNKVNIVITPKEGDLSEEDISFSQSAGEYDLILIFDTGNLEHLGDLYEKNVDLFYNTPVINIDHHTSNTDFGQINLVDSTAASATQVLYEYLEYLEKQENKKLITEDIATLLIAGIITDTGSFQHANTSPRAMEASAKLLDLGARQQEVIKNIYKTKKLSTLKLWGIILSKVQVDPIHRMVWSTLSTENFQEAGAQADETEGIIDDLLTNAPGAEVIFLIRQSPEYVSVSMRSTTNQANVGQFCADNGGGGHVRAAGFKIYGDQPFEQVVSDVISKVQAFQADRLDLNLNPNTENDEGLNKKTTKNNEAKPTQNKPNNQPSVPAKSNKPETVDLDFGNESEDLSEFNEDEDIDNNTFDEGNNEEETDLSFDESNDDDNDDNLFSDDLSEEPLEEDTIDDELMDSENSDDFDELMTSSEDEGDDSDTNDFSFNEELDSPQPEDQSIDFAQKPNEPKTESLKPKSTTTPPKPNNERQSQPFKKEDNPSAENKPKRRRRRKRRPSNNQGGNGQQNNNSQPPKPSFPTPPPIVQ